MNIDQGMSNDEVSNCFIIRHSLIMIRYFQYFNNSSYSLSILSIVICPVVNPTAQGSNFLIGEGDARTRRWHRTALGALLDAARAINNVLLHAEIGSLCTGHVATTDGTVAIYNGLHIIGQRYGFITGILVKKVFFIV